MSDLELHTKALDSLLAYYESEQWDTNMDETNILMTNQMVISELRYIRNHLKAYHEGIRAMELHEYVRQMLRGISEDDKNFRAIVWVKWSESGC